jgi:hypothetical protein
MQTIQARIIARFLAITLGLSALCGCDQVGKKLGMPSNSESASNDSSPGNPGGPSAGAPTNEKTQPAPGSVNAPDAGEAARFNSDYEKWKLRAVEEFPEIGVAGSGFNQQFLLEAKKLRESNAPELAHPNWPYLLALQVNTFLEKNKTPVPPSERPV